MHPSALLPLLSLLFCTTLALPAAGPSDGSTAFTISASHAGSPFDGQRIEASGHQFLITDNHGPTAYCPSPPVTDCPAGNVTALGCSTSGGGCSLAVEVPGGQRLYVEKSGKISYTIPHSGAIPDGAATDGFKVADGKLGFGKTGFVACPCHSQQGWYEIYAKVPGFKKKGCTGFEAVTAKFEDGQYGAWEYE